MSFLDEDETVLCEPINIETDSVQFKNTRINLIQ